MEKWPYDTVGSTIEGARLLNGHVDAEAETIFAALLQRDPGAAKKINQLWANAYISRGKAELQNRQDELAKAQFDLALNRNPSFAKQIDELWVDAYILRGEKLLGFPDFRTWGADKDEEAKTEFDLALQRDSGAVKKIDESWVSAYITRGATLLEQGKKEGAKAQFDLARQRRVPDELKVRTYSSIAWQWGLHQMPAEGLEDAERAVALAPNNGEALDTRGQIYLALDRIDAALTDFNRAIDNGHTSDAGTWYSRGLIMERKGEREAAISDYRHATEIATDNDYDLIAAVRERLLALGASAARPEDEPR
jgi:tetratricopeptide (TPR) repeat protein